MKRYATIAALCGAAILGLTGCAPETNVREDMARKENRPVAAKPASPAKSSPSAVESSLPPAVVSAAQQAVPGGSIVNGARDSSTVAYDVQMRAGDGMRDLKIRSDGLVLRNSRSYTTAWR